jgi:hypothetical protein
MSVHMKEFFQLALPKGSCQQMLSFGIRRLMPKQEQVNFQRDDDEVLFVLDQYAKLDFYSVSSLKQQSADGQVAPL